MPLLGPSICTSPKPLTCLRNTLTNCLLTLILVTNYFTASSSIPNCTGFRPPVLLNPYSEKLHYCSRQQVIEFVSSQQPKKFWIKYFGKKTILLAVPSLRGPRPPNGCLCPSPNLVYSKYCFCNTKQQQDNR